MSSTPAAAAPAGPRTILRMPEVMKRAGLKRTAIYRKIKAKEFPAPVKMGHASGWFSDELDDWMAKLSAARPASQPSGS